jgi:hypothetical protein
MVLFPPIAMLVFALKGGCLGQQEVSIHFKSFMASNWFFL